MNNNKKFEVGEEVVLRKNEKKFEVGLIYFVSPFGFMWSNSFYYLPAQLHVFCINVFCCRTLLQDLDEDKAMVILLLNLPLQINPCKGELY